ncbi:MAG TPA: universal stress protein, partial [Flavobacteriales bacterium]|nr:universal stress protein [Flavobacteriales bacterium]
MKDILCPTDLTPASENALRWGGAIAKAIGQSITLLHVLEKDERRGDLTELKARVASEAERFASGVEVRKEFP